MPYALTAPANATAAQPSGGQDRPEPFMSCCTASASPVIDSTAATGIIHWGGWWAHTRFSTQTMSAPRPAPPDMAIHWMPSPWKVYSPSTRPPMAANMRPATRDAANLAAGSTWLCGSTQRRMSEERTFSGGRGAAVACVGSRACRTGPIR